MGRALRIAFEEHLGQKDLQGQPYILHVLRVANEVPSDLIEAALLHDLLEDSFDWCEADLLKEGFSERVVRIVSTLTRGEEETYQGYIERVAKDREASLVKIADLEDNLNPSRGHIPESLKKRYEKALLKLTRATGR